MSRLDYITIGIVAACILAIIFLVYKMTDLFKDQPTTDPTETTTDIVEEEGDDLYNYDEEDDESARSRLLISRQAQEGIFTNAQILVRHVSSIADSEVLNLENLKEIYSKLTEADESVRITQRWIESGLYEFISKDIPKAIALLGQALHITNGFINSISF